MSLGKAMMQADYAQEMSDLKESEKEAAKTAEANQKKLGKRSMWGNIGKLVGTYALPAILGVASGGAALPLLATQMGGGLLGAALGSKLSGKKLKDTTVDVTGEGKFAKGMRGDLKTQTGEIFGAQTEAGGDILKNLAKGAIMSPLAGAAGKEVLGGLAPMTGPLPEDAGMWQKFLQSGKLGSAVGNIGSQLASDFPMYFGGQEDNRAFTPGA